VSFERAGALQKASEAARKLLPLSLWLRKVDGVAALAMTIPASLRKVYPSLQGSEGAAAIHTPQNYFCTVLVIEKS